MATREEIKQCLEVLFEPGDTVELRVPKARMSNGKSLGTISGYFNDYDALSADIEKYSGQFSGIYYTLNPVDPSLLARSSNKSRIHAQETTQDSQIPFRRWLLIDVDPARATGISASDSEKELAREKTREVAAYLKGQGWANPLVADSGNGHHLLYRLDNVPNTPENTVLFKSVLIALAMKFDSEHVKIDRTVFNAARIVKSYGSKACKGEELPEQTRFHRESKLTNTAGGKKFVTLGQLQMLAPVISTAAQPHKVGGLIIGSSGPGIKQENFETFLEFYGVEYTNTREQLNGSIKYMLKACPFNSEHNEDDVAAFWHENGALGFKCFHNSCSTYHWREFKEQLQRLTGKYFSLIAGKECDKSVEEPDEMSDVPQKRTALIHLLDPAMMNRVNWLWPGRIPLGNVTVFSGNAGIGKTLMALDLAARLSTGEKFIDRIDNENDPCSTLLLSQEDDANTIIGPRYTAAEGDMKRLFLCDGIRNEKGQNATLSLYKDRDLIREHLLANSDIKLIVIDPLMSYLGKKDGYKPQEMRDVLLPLTTLAQEFNVAIIVIAHNSKKIGVPEALHKIGGSAAIGEVVRHGWLFSSDEDKDITTMSQIKFNLGKFAGIDFTTIGVEIPARSDLGEQAKVKYIGENSRTSEEIVAASEDFADKKERRNERRLDTLKALFKSGSKVYVSDFKDDLMERWKCSWDALSKMGKLLGVYSNEDTKGSFWVWQDDSTSDNQPAA